MVWLEVETKVKIDKDEVAELRNKIKKIAKLEKKESRSDDYFALKRKIRKHGYPKKSFRIRKSGGKYVVNFKRRKKRHYDSWIVVKQEHEFETEHPEEFLELMFDLGFKQWVKKFKTTESYIYKKDKRVIIEINKVKHLGYFMEIEYLAHPFEIKKAKAKIMGILKQLGIKKEQINNKGYTRMLWDKGIKDKKHWVD